MEPDHLTRPAPEGQAFPLSGNVPRAATGPEASKQERLSTTMRKHSRWRCAAFLAAGLTLASCGGDRNERLNIRPPAPGIPSGAASVSGIYRSIHQGLLQLRENGELSLIIPDVSASAGTFTLEDGNLVVQTARCGAESGRYRLEVTGEQLPGKATLNITAVDDPCDERRRYLTIDPWVYGDS